MKRTFILIILSLMIPAISFSQVFEGGFFGGFTASQIEQDTYSGFDKFGLTFGAYILKEHLSRTNWKGEIRYIQKGSADRGTDDDPSYYKLTIHYVEIPLLYQFEWKERIILEAGLVPDVYLFHKEEDENGEISQDDQPEYHRFGLNGDIGVYYRFSDRVLIGIRNSNSILAMRDHASGQTYYLNRGQYNKLFHFSVYYHFD